MTNTESIALLIAMTIVNVIGTISITFAAKGHGLHHLALGCALYHLGALMMYRLVADGGDVSLWGPLSAIAGLLILTLYAHFRFFEVITTLRLTGLGFASLAIMMMALSHEAAR